MTEYIRRRLERLISYAHNDVQNNVPGAQARLDELRAILDDYLNKDERAKDEAAR